MANGPLVNVSLIVIADSLTTYLLSISLQCKEINIFHSIEVNTLVFIVVFLPN